MLQYKSDQFLALALHTYKYMFYILLLLICYALSHRVLLDHTAEMTNHFDKQLPLVILHAFKSIHAIHFSKLIFANTAGSVSFKNIRKSLQALLEVPILLSSHTMHSAF